MVADLKEKQTKTQAANVICLTLVFCIVLPVMNIYLVRNMSINKIKALI